MANFLAGFIDFYQFMWADINTVNMHQLGAFTAAILPAIVGIVMFVVFVIGKRNG